MLSIRKVSAGYSGLAVVHDIDLEVRAGEIIAMIGANGAGKSTIAKAVSGLLPVLRGEIELNGRSVAGAPVAERMQLGLVHVPEGRQIFARLTVQQNLELGSYAIKGQSRKQLSALIEEALAYFPILRHRVNDLAGNLSGGQQQMLAIARGMMSRPKLLILDEPSLGLSPSMVQEVFKLVAGLRAKGVAILLAEQNARMSLAIADRGYVIENGRVVLADTARSLLDSEDIAARYLGLGEAGATGRIDAKVHASLVSTIRQIQTLEPR
jgi:branched-chain amino acid transport system ATP-binding protein